MIKYFFFFNLSEMFIFISNQKPTFGPNFKLVSPS